MGLLDDAIREHLDLKRRRGADPSEIAREEAEALGPVRRDAPEEEPPAAAVGGSHADHEPAALDQPALAYDDEPLDDDLDYEDEPAAAAPRADDDARDRPHLGDPPTTRDRAWAEPEAESATPPHGDPLAHQPTREFSATELGEALGHHEAPAAEPSRAPAGDAGHADAPADPTADADADPDSADEDELGQTPDFLQETPEHDRLWFEQKPPKDFDF
jgi:hypothetical protein